MSTTAPRHDIDTHPALSGQLSVSTIVRRQPVPGATAAMRAVLFADSPNQRRRRPFVGSGRPAQHAAPFVGDDTATVKFPKIVLTAAAQL